MKNEWKNPLDMTTQERITALRGFEGESQSSNAVSRLSEGSQDCPDVGVRTRAERLEIVLMIVGLNTKVVKDYNMTKQGSCFSAIVAIFIFCCVLAICGGMLTSIIVYQNRQNRQIAYYSHNDTFTAKVVRKYEYVSNGYTFYLVDIQKSGSETIETIQNNADHWLKKWNSVTIQANLMEGKWYKFEVVGFRSEPNGLFPNIVKVSDQQPQ